ncbi:MAG: hypothetical protein HYW00_01585 [Candidatus Colwellbacteria bacterium]|nr:hypothetical protein [Candidatus Colwellbacteria bacterium]
MFSYLLDYSEVAPNAWIGLLGLLAAALIVGCLYGLVEHAWRGLHRYFKQ